MFLNLFVIFKDVTPEGNGEEIDGIYAEIKTEVYRDEVLVCEHYAYNQDYNLPNQDWQTVNIPLTDNFTEGGQQFKFNISARFIYDSEVNDIITFKLDYARLEVFYAPCYFREFDFSNGFNDFTSPSIGTVESSFWDSENLC